MFHNNPAERRNYLSRFVRLATHPVFRALILAFGLLTLLFVSQSYAAPTAGSIGDYVWYDYDLDGLQDPGEPGLPGVTVTLHHFGSGVVATTTTDVNGLYSFTGLPDSPTDAYRVAFEEPPGYDFSPKDQVW